LLAAVLTAPAQSCQGIGDVTVTTPLTMSLALKS
jgi:hypothetical protein